MMHHAHITSYYSHIAIQHGWKFSGEWHNHYSTLYEMYEISDRYLYRTNDPEALCKELGLELENENDE